jgi:hypothetical protein
VRGFHEALQTQNDYRADHGGTKADHQANGRSSVLTHALLTEATSEADQ